MASGMGAWLIKKGLARDARQADYILIGVAVAALVLALALPKLIGNASTQIPKGAVGAAMQLQHPPTR